ncbi:hypothetical protein HZY62_04780 [Maribacter polysiphoniae]|uniref:WD40 repeat protein n=1 Tax=Maribacter polysiphoniae TaxID=429344 RepID=A0A316E5J0_9FLAO|nr:hypothetical protein [Maribacter polysiphoniae]MBD1259892.1 hypothetical protein [Maribacter polysiphoniae]PWK25346.1 hypothetical protein LX92_00085 [Maribacter polysiphoniae]
MNFRKYASLFILFIASCTVVAQEIPLDFSIGEKYNDRYKYSNLLTISNDGKGGTFLVRSYYTGVILKPKGYLIEHYDANMQLINEYNYKLKNANLVDGYVANGQIYLIFLDYDYNALAYEYSVHRSPLSEMNFTKETLLTVQSQEVSNPLDKNYYNRNFSSGFTTSVLFNDKKNAFVISTHFKKGKTNKHFIYMFNASLQKVAEHDFSAEVEEKNYAFENVAFSKDLQEAYIIGKAYFKKKRFLAKDRRFQYELIKVSRSGAQTQTFDGPGKFSEALIPVIKDNELFCVGFYANRKDNRYNGLAYFKINMNTLEINTKKYSPFSEQFMVDKFGREEDKVIKDLVFKNVNISNDGTIHFNAEEYFITTSVQANSSGGRLKVTRYHHNDIVSAKLSADGDMLWARNINKAEVTQGDGAYASYSSYTKDGNTYFFISTAAENPQLLPGDRLLFKQGLSRNRNVFVIKLDTEGHISYKKLIDDKEARLPLMVSKPLFNTQDNQIIFYAKRGNKKQLVSVLIK